ncbi:MAG: hypothetical protein ACOX3T_03560 [Bdellovibrionota bacterium]
MYFYDFNFKEYSLGTKLDFSSNKYNIINYFEYGISEPEDGFAWTSENEIELSFNFVDDVQVIVGSFDLLTVYNESQNVKIYVNDIVAFDETIKESECVEKKINFIFSKPFDGKVKIRLILNDAISPYELSESEDKRKLSLCIKSLVFERCEVNSISSQKKISFLKNEQNFLPYLISGVSSAESIGAWTDAKQVMFAFNFENKQECLMFFDAKLSAINNDSQNVQIFANDVLVFHDEVASLDGIKFYFVVPRTKIVFIRILLKNAFSPKSFNVSEDVRLLGLMFQSISFSEVKLVSYELNTMLNAIKNDFSVKPYIFSGLSIPEKDYTWADGKRLLFGAKIEDYKANQSLKCKVFLGGVMRETQRVSILVFGIPVFFGNIDSSITEIDFDIPPLGNDNLVIEFFMLDATSPHSENSQDEDKRLLSLRVKSIIIE